MPDLFDQKFNDALTSLTPATPGSIAFPDQPKFENSIAHLQHYQETVQLEHNLETEAALKELIEYQKFIEGWKRELKIADQKIEAIDQTVPEHLQHLCQKLDKISKSGFDSGFNSMMGVDEPN